MLRDGAARGARWSSHRAFLVAAIGATLGLGNVWRFPLLVDAHGGLAFVAAYAAALLLLGLPLLRAELELARRAPGPLPARFPRLIRQAQAHPAWRGLPWLLACAAWLVAAYLALSATWLLDYLAGASRGAFAEGTTRAVALRFDAVAGDPLRGAAWLTLFLGSAVAACAAGVRRGLERVAFAGLGIVALAWGLALVIAALADGLGPGGGRLLAFEPAALGAAGLWAALTQAFYTLTLGVGVMHVYATHLPRGSALPRLAWRIVLGDTLFALLATLVVLGVLGAAGVEPTTGPRLVFERLPLALGRLPGGGALAVALYLGLVGVAWLTAVALLESLTFALTAWHRLDRVRAALLVGASLWLAGWGLLVDFAGSPGGRWASVGAYGWVEFLGGRLLVPLGALLVALFVGWQLPERRRRHALASWSGSLALVGRTLLRYAAPSLLLVLLLAVTGILPAPS